MTKSVIILSLLLIIAACDKKEERAFIWDQEIANLTQNDLEKWLLNAPFKNEMSSNRSSENRIIFTNVSEVFPFYKQLYNDNGDINNYTLNNDIYQDEALLYKDPEWGDVLVYGALLYDNEELFLKRLNSTSGSPLFSGPQAINQWYSADLMETKLVNKTSSYKTAVYWIERNRRQGVLLGFYQKRQLVVQIALPCEVNNKEKCLNKLKEFNASLNLNATEWHNASLEDLMINPKPLTFWIDPYETIYDKNYHWLKLKIARTNFSLYKYGYANRKGVDLLYGYKGEHGTAEITTKLVPTRLAMEEYFKQAQAPITIKAKSDSRKIFITEKSAGGNVSGKAETYFADNQLLEITYQFPNQDHQVKMWIKDMLTNIIIR